MPRKKLKNPDRIKHIFMEKRKSSVNTNDNGRATNQLMIRDEGSKDRININAQTIQLDQQQTGSNMFAMNP